MKTKKTLKSKIKPKIKSKGKGYKICSSCHSNQGVRTKKCKVCNQEFPPSQPKLNFKRKKAKIEKIDWKTLQKGDRIRVYAKGGTIFEAQDMVYNINRRGIYIVDRLSKDGIHAFSKEGTGHNFIFMGKEKINKLGFINRPHLIRKILG